MKLCLVWGSGARRLSICFSCLGWWSWWWWFPNQPASGFMFWCTLWLPPVEVKKMSWILRGLTNVSFMDVMVCTDVFSSPLHREFVLLYFTILCLKFLCYPRQVSIMIPVAAISCLAMMTHHFFCIYKAVGIGDGKRNAWQESGNGPIASPFYEMDCKKVWRQLDLPVAIHCISVIVKKYVRSLSFVCWQSEICIW